MKTFITIALPVLALLFAAPGEAARHASRHAEPHASIEAWITAGRYAQADSAAGALRTRVESAARVDSLELARALDLVARARILGDLGSIEENLATAEHALRIKEARLAADDPQIAASASNVAEGLRARGRYAEALVAFRRALAIRERGGDELELAGALNDVAKSLRDLGKTAEARPLYERALAIRERRLEPDDPLVATSLSNLASLLRDVGETERARAMFERALAIRRKAFGDNDASVARVLQGIAVLLRRSGDYEGARARYLEALATAQRAYPPRHPELARYYTSVGAIDYLLADYEDARAALESALEIATASFGPDHPELSPTLTNLGVLALELGDNEIAAQRFRGALAIVEKTRGPESGPVALSLNNLGIALSRMGRHAEADSVLERAMRIMQKVEGGSTALAAACLISRSDDAYALGDLARARAYSERALAIAERLSPRNPEAPLALENLGALAAAEGDHSRARDFYARAIAIRRAIMGGDHPLVARALAGQAASLLALGETQEAARVALEAESIRRDHIRSTVRWLPERQALRYEERFPPGLDVAVAIAVAGGNDSAVVRAWDAVVRSRALVLDEMASRRRERGALREASPDTVSLLEAAVAVARRRFASLALRGPEDVSTETYKALLDSARSASEHAEQELLAHSATWRRNRARENAGLDDALRGLPPGAALVSYVRFQQDGSGGSGPVASYAAFVRASEGVTRAVLLGRAGEIDSLIDRWRERAGRWPSERNPKADLLEERRRSEALRARLWDPVARLVGGSERVVLVPEAAIHLVSFPALRRSDGRFLAENGPTFQVISAERDLALDPRGEAGTGGFLALGDPDYDSAEPDSDGETLVAGSSIAVPTSLGFRRGSVPCALSLNRIHWPRLPETEREVSDLERLWSALAPGASFHRLVGAAASEVAFRRLAPTSRFLHLATHAFFFEGCGEVPRAQSRGVGGLAVGSSGGATAPVPVPALEESPLLRSGLVLAGANAIGSGGAADSTGEDGILTADEIAAMDLSGVESAVLSGCDTGVGAVRAGEGVFGLRRAFEIAGARGLVLSLWPVSDRSAREWIHAFYEARLARGMPPSDAARDASRALLAARRAEGRSVHPYFWAGFIATGR